MWVCGRMSVCVCVCVCLCCMYMCLYLSIIRRTCDNILSTDTSRKQSQLTCGYTTIDKENQNQSNKYTKILPGVGG